MVNNSTNINKMNNHFSLQLLIQKIPRHWKAVIIDSSKKDINNKNILKLKSSTYHNNFVLSRVVVQVPWVPEVTECHVTPSGFPWVCVCSTGSCAISALCNGVCMRNGSCAVSAHVGPFDRK